MGVGESFSEKGRDRMDDESLLSWDSGRINFLTSSRGHQCGLISVFPCWVAILVLSVMSYTLKSNPCFNIVNFFFFFLITRVSRLTYAHFD